MEERRRNGRWQINQEARISLLEEKPVLLEGTVDDITFRGAKVSLKQPLPEKPTLSLNISIWPGLVLSGLEVIVAWRKETEETNTYGFSFNRIKDIDKQKIYDFVSENFPQEISRQWWKGIEVKKE